MAGQIGRATWLHSRKEDARAALMGDKPRASN
jgi:hypothetical protein